MKSTANSLPPGPPLAAWQTVRYVRDPLRFYQWCARRYGDIFTFRSLEGAMVVTASPEGIRDVFSADPDTFGVHRAEIFGLLVGKQSLSSLEGQRHKVERKLLTPAFHGPRLRAYGDVMRDIAARAAHGLPRSAPFLIEPTLYAIGLEVVIRTVFGITEPARVRELSDLALELVAVATKHPFMLYLKELRRDLFGVGPWARFQRAQRRLDAFLFAEIAARRADGRSGDDILSMLLAARYDDGAGMSVEAVRDELMTLLFAGYETTVITMEWMVYLLHAHTDKLARLRDEISSLGPDPASDAIAALPYLDAVCQETLRMFPAGFELNRVLKRPLTVQGYDLPAGTVVDVCPALVHEREDVFPEPHRFMPERFLSQSYTPFQFVPFGGGARRCIGAAFTVYETKMVLATLLGTCRLRLTTDGPVRAVRKHFVMAPDRPVELAFDA